MAIVSSRDSSYKTRPAKILWAQVMHQRLFPKRNSFRYGIYYLALPITPGQTRSTDWLPRGLLTRWRTINFRPQDHGARDGGNLWQWACNQLEKFDIPPPQSITLLCMPRIFGYVFNPVSFWLCQDSNGDLRAVIAEVNNTFGETHSYVCAHADHRVIGDQDKLQAYKIFHVSPFLQRSGSYRFYFHLGEESCDIHIIFDDKTGKQQLVTRLWGAFAPLDSQNLQRAFWQHPLVTWRTIFLIHYQAIKLLLRGIRYIGKPKQNDSRVTRNND